MIRTADQRANILLELINKYKNKKQPIPINFREIVPEIKNTDRATHFIHKYPAKLLQHIPFFLLNNEFLSKEGETIYDPFMGSGTVLLEGILANRQTLGSDINPLAALISKVKTRNYNTHILDKSLWQILDSYRSNNTAPETPNVTNINYWHNKESIVRISRLKHAIDSISNPQIKEFFQISLSTCIRKFSYADPNVSVPVKINIERFSEGHRLRNCAIKHINEINSLDITDYFTSVSLKNISRFTDLSLRLKNNSYTRARVLNCDAKSISRKKIDKESIDLVITSPPYVSAQKYIRSSRLSIEWLELGSNKTVYYDKKSIGREDIAKSEATEITSTGNSELDAIINKINKINPLRGKITYKYITEMTEVFKTIHHILKPNKYFAMIIGNNTVAGIDFETEKYLRDIAEKTGFETILILIDDIKSRGLMTKRNKTANTISREYVIIFQKVQT